LTALSTFIGAVSRPKPDCGQHRLNRAASAIPCETAEPAAAIAAHKRLGGERSFAYIEPVSARLEAADG
jgi:hypothetical protein